MNPLPVRSLLLLALAASALAAEAPPKTEADILKGVRVPEGYEATVFAMPPAVGYPTALSASADGVVFVAVDENGSLDAKPGRGRVLRCIDADGDGKAEKITTFAEMDSPRGVIWDGASGTGPGTLYVMHPPNLTAYTDTDGDGKADKIEEIVTGLGFDLKFRGADHTTNGCRLGIDGFIYVAVGDYGFINAKAKDGTTLTNRGGGIVRVRPDGTGFEIVSRGQRNIYDVAVSPTLDLFTRDNTNDGGGWDVRLSFVPPGAHLGYPTLFKNFPEDMLQPLADYGGGSPCGALWLDDPGLQNGLYTVEWGRNAIFYHPLTAQGAGWKAEQKEWLKMPRPTDMDVDAAGRLYIASWDGATYTYNGPHAGYVVRVVKKGAAPWVVPNFRTATPEVLIRLIGAAGAVTRQAAQRELLRRGAQPEFAAPLRKLAETPSPVETPASMAVRVAAVETLAQLYGARALPVLAQFAAADNLREAALRALGTDIRLAAQVPLPPLTAGLADPSPRVRAAALAAARRLGRADAAPAMLPLVADADPVIAHLAVRALGELKAAPVLLAALDSSDDKVKLGALRALYGFYDPKVADALIARLATTREPALRQALLTTLCRLDNKDTAYVDPKVWWGTRPDTSGPVYKAEPWEASPKIEAALKTALDAAQGEDGRALVLTMYKTKVNFPGLVELMLAKAGTDTAAKLTAIEGLFSPDNALPSEALTALTGIAGDDKQAPDFRAKALRLLARASERGAALDAAVTAFAPFATQPGHASITAAFEDFTRDGKQTKNINALDKIATGNDPVKRTLAQTILVNLSTSALVKGKDKENAEKAVAKAWEKPETAASLLGVIARTKSKSYADQVTAHLKDPNNAVAESALFAYQALGLKDTGAPAVLIGTMKYEAVFAAVQKGGDAAQGRDMFLRAGCIACHTITADEPAKGPILSAVAKIYDRAALTESLLKPNAKLAQGFETATFKTKKGEEIQGFVTREGGDSVDVRNIAGQTVTLEKGDITARGKLEQSMMPEGLLNSFTPADLANLLAYMESLKTAK